MDGTRLEITKAAACIGGDGRHCFHSMRRCAQKLGFAPAARFNSFTSRIVDFVDGQRVLRVMLCMVLMLLCARSGGGTSKFDS